MSLLAGRLQIGLSQPLHIRSEVINARPDACRVLYISDIHLRPGRSHTLSRQLLATVDQSQPDVILLGGDLLDRRSELDPLTELVRRCRRSCRVFAIGGNHDQRIGLDRVRKSVEDAGGQWIHDRAVQVSIGKRIFSICGPESKACGSGDVRILCAHNPRIWKRARHQGYDLVLAGHLHGCQAVAFECRDRLFPGALFYPACYLSHRSENSRLVVSRGVSDLIPIRWCCPREVVVCHV